MDTIIGMKKCKRSFSGDAKIYVGEKNVNGETYFFNFLFWSLFVEATNKNFICHHWKTETKQEYKSK